MNISHKEILKRIQDREITPEEGLRLLEQSSTPSAGTSGTGISILHYLAMEWVPGELAFSGVNPKLHGNLLILDCDGVFRDEMAKRIGRDRVILVQPGDCYRENGNGAFTINPEQGPDYLRLLQELKQANQLPLHIIHGWSRETRDSLPEQLARGVYSLLYLTQAYMALNLNREINLVYLYFNSETNSQSENAAVGGFCKTVRLENPKFLFKTVAFDGSSLHGKTVKVPPELPESILRELVAGETEHEVRYDENGRRFVKRPVAIPVKPTVQGPLPLRKNGVYLITGGAGGLGQIFAEYLAREFQAKLVLTGRSGLNSALQSKIKTLEQWNSEVIYIQADVSQNAEAERLIKEAKQRFGAIHGVIHSAGLIRDSFVIHKTPQEMDEVLAAKVYGTVNLDRATQNEALDFLVLFSSTSAVFGNMGQADYAFGNSFMDHYAQFLSGRRSGKILSINWPLWRDGGLGVDKNTEKWLKETWGLVPLDGENGIQAFSQTLQMSHSQVAVLLGSQDAMSKIIPSAPRAANIPKQVERTQEPAVEAASLNFEKAEQYLKNLLSKAMKIPVEKLSSTEPLEKYGIDSVMAMNLTRELEKEFGELRKTLFFEFQNIQALTGYFIENHQARMMEKTGVSGSASTESIPVPKAAPVTPDIHRIRFMETVSRPQTTETDIAIIGVSGRYPMAPDLDTFWENLKNGKDCITEIPADRWDYQEYFNPDRNHKGTAYSKWGGFLDDVDKFDPLFFNIAPLEAEYLDPQERLFLEVVWQTLEDAGYPKNRLGEAAVGVFVGVMYGQYQLFGTDQYLAGQFLPGSSYASIANRVSYYFNFHGPSLALDTMCSSSLVAIHLACDSIRKGESTMAIAGGVNVSIHPHKYLLLSQGGYLSSDGHCRSFGEGGDGYVPGEGVGAVLLKSLDQARRDGDRIYAVIKGSAVNHGGKTNGYTVPNPNAQGDLILKALEQTKIDPRTIGYIEAHGTGTSLGDPIEITGLEKAFGKYTHDRQFCAIGSVKSNIGHLESAAGIAGITKVMLQMKHRTLVPSLHSEQLNPNINFEASPFYVQQNLAPWEPLVRNENQLVKTYPRRAGISSFGAGGSNAHIILEEYDSGAQGLELVNPEPSPQLIVLSARNMERLKAHAGNLADYLEKSCEYRPDEPGIRPGLARMVREDMVRMAAAICQIQETVLMETDSWPELEWSPFELMEFTGNINREYALALEPGLISGFRSFKELAGYLVKEHGGTIEWHFPQSPKPASPKNVQVGNGITLSQVAYTLQTGREAMDERMALAVSGFGELVDCLRAFQHGEVDETKVFHNNIKTNPSTGAKATTDFIKTGINQENLAALGRLWTSGAEVDWNILYPGGTPKRVSLPAYPFARTRCWLPETGSAKRLDTVKLHPLIDRNISDLQGPKYTTRFRGNEFYFNGCRISGEKVLPGIAGLEMARAAGELAGPGPVRSLRRIRFIQPLSLVEDPVEVQVSLRAHSGGAGFSIASLDERQSPVVHLRGEMVYRTGAETESETPLNIESMKTGSAIRRSKNQIYGVAQLNTIQYGPAFQVIEEYFGSTTEAFSCLELPGELKAGFRDYGLHPALLDGALQTVTQFMADFGPKPEAPMMLYEAEEVIVEQPLTESCFVRVRPAESDHESGQYNITIVDTTGQVLVALKKVTLAPVHRETGTMEEGSALIPEDKRYTMMEKQWQQSAIAPAPGFRFSGRVILLANPESQSMVRFLAGVAPLTIVWEGTGFEVRTETEYVFDPDQAGDGLRLAGALKSIEKIWGVIDLTDFRNRPELTVRMGKITLLQELLKVSTAAPLNVMHFTQGLQTFMAGEPALTGAITAGFIRMLSAEYRMVQAKTIDLDSKDDGAQLAAIICTEAGAVDGQSEVCYRNGKRYVPALVELASGAVNTASNIQKINFDPAKVYVITGGTRGIGAEFAQYLAGRSVRKLVLMGAQALPPREQWAAIPDDPGNRSTLQKIAMIQRLEAQGVTVKIYTGSLTEQSKLDSYFQTIRRELGKIGGVFHCAGLSIDTEPAFINKKPEDIRRVLEPKTVGLQVLHQVFSPDQLDFFLLFSSVSALIPALGSGMSDYAAANAFMDYFAGYQFIQGHTYYQSISWPSWKEIGMAGDRPELAGSKYHQLGLRMISPREGLWLFETTRNYPKACLGPLIVDSGRFNLEGMLRIPRETNKAVPVNRETTASGKSADMGNNWLASLFARELKIPEENLDPDTSFNEYGVDSILIAGLVKKVEEQIGKKLDPSVFLEYPTLRSLSRYLDSNHGEEVRDMTAAVSDTVTNKAPEPRLGFQFTSKTRRFDYPPERQGFTTSMAASQSGSGQIAVIGVACHFPGAPDKERYWENLAAGVSSITEVPKNRWDIEQYYAPAYQKGKSISKWGGFINDIEYFDPLYFKFSEEEAPNIDPLIRQFLEVTQETLFDAGYDKKELWNRKIGVFAGSRAGAYMPKIRLTKNSIIGVGQNFIAAHVSHFFNFKGPNMVIDTACSSSLVSIHLACQSLLSGESEMALAGGVDILLDEKPYIMLSEGRALSPDGKCHTFDEKANGFVPGEGCGVVMLKPLEKAMADGDRIYAVIEVSSVNNDGNTMGVTTPNPEAQVEVIAAALAKGGIHPGSIGYVETHGTGTMIGDPIELKALTKIFGQYTQERGYCGVGSVKTNFGHLLSAAGIASFIKVVLALQHREIPPTLNCETPNPRFEFKNSPFYPVTQLQKWEPRDGIRRSGISSFGFGGTNAHMIVSEGNPHLLSGYQPRRRPLPPVRFAKKRYWLDSISSSDLLSIAEETGGLMNTGSGNKGNPGPFSLLTIVDETE